MFPGLTPRFWVFAAFVALVFLLGGGSRSDIASLVVLRPACAFFAAYALTVAAPGDIARVRVPLLLLLALGVWMVVQLIPLPPSVWSGLPGRAALLEIDRLVGLEGTWRPISLAPSKTMNSLASLVVPAAALLLYAVQRNDDRRRILGLLVAVAAVGVLLGLGQFASGGSGPLYFYNFTNLGFPVGFFANRNHNAVFLATMFVVAGHWFAEHRRLARRGESAIAPALVGGVCLLVLVTLAFSQSRAGLLIGILALGMGIALYVAARRDAADRDDHHHGNIVLRNWPFVLMLVVALGAVLFLFTQSSTFDRLMSQSLADEIRVQVFPQVSAMASDNWLAGTGFGSFEYAYRAYESSDWLNTTYLNNAHDDWLQWVIEGGLPAILIFLAFCVWLASTCLGHWRAREANPARTRLVAMALGVLVLLLIASTLDYPLRVPSMMLYAVLMIALVADPPEPQAKEKRRSSKAQSEGGSRRSSGPELKGAPQ